MEDKKIQGQDNNEELLTEEIDSFFDDLKKAFKSLLSGLGRMSFDKYVEALSEAIDRDIGKSLNADAEKQCLGGYIYFSISEDKKLLNFRTEIFYKKSEQWLKDEKKGKTEIKKFDPKLSKETLEEIWKTQKSGEDWKYKIDPPMQNM